MGDWIHCNITPSC